MNDKSLSWDGGGSTSKMHSAFLEEHRRGTIRRGS